MTQWALWGTIVNTGAVILGALVGLAIRALAKRLHRGKVAEVLDAGEKQENHIAAAVQKGVVLCVVLIGIMGASGVQNVLVMIVSVVLGTLVGELLDLDRWLSRLGTALERRMKGRVNNVAEGFVTATMLFCVGAMTVTGALESGVLRTHDTYYAKSMLDMVSSVIFASSLGFGVMFSAVGVFAIQGALVLIAVLAGNAIPVAITAEMIAVGSLLVIFIGTNLIGITRIKVMNLVPAMLWPIALCPLFELLF